MLVHQVPCHLGPVRRLGKCSHAVSLIEYNGVYLRNVHLVQALVVDKRAIISRGQSLVVLLDSGYSLLLGDKYHFVDATNMVKSRQGRQGLACPNFHGKICKTRGSPQ